MKRLAGNRILVLKEGNNKKGDLFESLTLRGHSWLLFFVMSFLFFFFFMKKPSPAATLGGYVVSAPGSNAIAGITVMTADIRSDFHTLTTTEIDGSYRFDELGPGVYIVWVKTGQSGFVAEFYDDAPDYSQAEPIPLGETEERFEINFTLTTGRSISGRVTKQDNGQPIEGLMIGALGQSSMTMGYNLADIPDYFHEISCLGKTMNCAFTDSNGIYTICGLSPQRYQVGQLSQPNIYSQYIPEWYEEAENPFTAALIPLEPENDVDGIDLALSIGCSIFGKITDPNGSPIEDRWVLAISPEGYYPSGFYAPPACSDPNGRYSIGKLKPGDYIVDAGSEYYYAASNSNVFYAEPIKVQVTDIVTGPHNFILKRKKGGTVSGKVTQAKDDAPVSGIFLSAIPSTSSTSYSYNPLQTQTDPNGYYIFDGLSTGSYIICIVSQSYLFLKDEFSQYLTQYYNGVSEYELATPVIVADQGEISHLNFALIIGGRVSGKITSAADQAPIAGLSVAARPCPAPEDAYSNHYGSYGGYAPYGEDNPRGVSDYEGKYTIQGLETGSYQIFVENSGQGYYNYTSGRGPYLSAEYGEGECVGVIAPFDNPNTNISLQMGGSISGLVTDMDTNSPLSGIQIQAKMIEPEEKAEYPYGGFEEDTLFYAETDMFGHYTMVGLPTGEYQMVACDKRGEYSCSTYQVVQIEAGQDISNINFSLKMGGTISGKITDEASGLSLAGIQVKAVDMDYDIFDPYYSMYEFSSPYYAGSPSQDSMYFAMTDGEGNYTITGLGTSKYRLIAGSPKVRGIMAITQDANNIYLPEYYDNLPLANQDDVFYTELSREFGLNVSGNPTLEFKIKGDSRFQLALEMGDAGGDSLCVFFQSGDNGSGYQMKNPYLDTDGSLVVRLEEIKEWEIYDDDDYDDLDELLQDFKPGFVLNSIDKITLRGNSYWIDYIKLLDANSSPLFDNFDYQDLPTDHGWFNNHQQSTFLAMTQDLDSEDGALRVTSGQAVAFTEANNTITDCNFELSKASAISGTALEAVTGDPLEGIEVIAYDYSRAERINSSFTDQQGAYVISGLGPGEYSLLAVDHELNYLEQYYDHIENPYTGYVIDDARSYWGSYSVNDYHHFRGRIKKYYNAENLNNHIVEFRLKTNYTFCLSLKVDTTEGKSVRVDIIPSTGSATPIVLNDILQVKVKGEYELDVWQMYQVDLNALLSQYMNTAMDQVQEITLKGNEYRLDFIRLVQEGQSDEDIDHFEYLDSPSLNGWINLGALTSHIETVHDQQVGSRVLRVLPYTLIALSTSQHCADRDFTLTRGACLCGKVMDDANNPLAGIQITPLAEGRNLAYYAASGMGYGIGYGSYLPTAPSGQTDSIGEYCLKGLFPGEYRVLAGDPQNYYTWRLYSDIPFELPFNQSTFSPYNQAYIGLPYLFHTCLHQDLDLSYSQFDNPICSFQGTFRERMEICLEVETESGRDMTIVLHCGTGEEPDYDPNTHVVVSVYPPSEYGYYQPEPAWFLVNRNVNTDLLNHSPWIGTLQKINGVSIRGNDYRLDFIKFLGNDYQTPELFDEFTYAEASDLNNHGWINEHPETTYLAMVEDKELERKVLAVSATTSVGLSQGGIKEGIDFHLKPGAKIEGMVTAQDGGTPLAGISIVADKLVSGGISSGYGSYAYGYAYGYDQYDFSATTDSEGHYTLLLLCSEEQSKEYSLKALDYQDIYADTPYDQTLQVTPGDVKEINLSMSKAASISGKVTAAFDGHALAYVQVQARIADEYYSCCLGCGNYSGSPAPACCSSYPFCSPYTTIKTTYTNSQGEYTLKNLPPNGYVICALYSNGGFYDDNSDYLDPSIILTPGQELTSINIQCDLNHYTYSSSYFSPTIYDTSPTYGSYGGNYYGSQPSPSPSSDTQTSPQEAFYNPFSLNPPVIISTPETTVTIDELYTYRITIQDPNSYQDDLTFQLTKAPDGMCPDDPNSRITWIPDSSQIGSHLVRLGVNSSTSGLAKQEFTIKVLDYMVLSPCHNDDDISEWVIEGNGTLDCVYDQELKTHVLEAQTSESNSLDFTVRYPSGEMSSQSGTLKGYLSLAISDTDIFRLHVHVLAGGNDYTLTYSPTEGEADISGNTIHYHLGSKYRDGNWHIANRDLSSDLDLLGVGLEGIKYVQIQGDYRLYGLKMGINPFDDELIYIEVAPGLNLIGLSKDKIKEYGDSADLLENMAGAAGLTGLSKYNTFLNLWQKQLLSSESAEFEIKDYQGYCLYATEPLQIVFHKDTLPFDISEIAGRLRPGLNLIHIARLPQHPYLASELIKELETIITAKVINIHKYGWQEGRWLGAYGFFDLSMEKDFELKIGEAYIINILP